MDQIKEIINKFTIGELYEIKNIIKEKIMVKKCEKNKEEWKKEIEFNTIKKDWFKRAITYLEEWEDEEESVVKDSTIVEEKELLNLALDETFEYSSDFWLYGDIMTKNNFCTHDECYYFHNRCDRIDEVHKTYYLMGDVDYMRCDPCMGNYELDVIEKLEMCDYIQEKCFNEFVKIVKIHFEE